MTVGVAERQRIATLLQDAGYEGSGAAIALLPGTGNRTFAVTWPGGDVVVRLPGSETGALVDRVAERHNMALAAGLGLAPRLLHVDPSDGALVMVRAPGGPPSDVSGLRRMGATLAALHRAPRFRGVMDPWAKIALYLDEAGVGAPDRPDAFGGLWSRIAGLAGTAALDPSRLAPCHVDPIPANAIDDGERVVLIDWEYAAMSDPLWDLAYACVEGALEDAGEAALLAGYGLDNEGRARVGAWKTVVRVVSAAWCMARAAAGDAPAWRREVAIRLAALAADLDDPASARGVRP